MTGRRWADGPWTVADQPGARVCSCALCTRRQRLLAERERAEREQRVLDVVRARRRVAR